MYQRATRRRERRAAVRAATVEKVNAVLLISKSQLKKVVTESEECLVESEEDQSELEYNESVIPVDLKRMLPVIVMRG